MKITGRWMLSMVLTTVILLFGGAAAAAGKDGGTKEPGLVAEIRMAVEQFFSPSAPKRFQDGNLTTAVSGIRGFGQDAADPLSPFRKGVLMQCWQAAVRGGNSESAAELEGLLRSQLPTADPADLVAALVKTVPSAEEQLELECGLWLAAIYLELSATAPQARPPADYHLILGFAGRFAAELRLEETDPLHRTLLHLNTLAQQRTLVKRDLTNVQSTIENLMASGR